MNKFDHRLGGLLDTVIPQPVKVEVTVDSSTRDWVDSTMTRTDIGALLIPIVVALIVRNVK